MHNKLKSRFETLNALSALFKCITGAGQCCMLRIGDRLKTNEKVNINNEPLIENTY